MHSPIIREEVSLEISPIRLLAEVLIGLAALSQSNETGVHPDFGFAGDAVLGCRRLKDVEGLMGLVGPAHSGEETACGRVGRAGTAERVPDGAFSSPVLDERTAEDPVDAL